jgi:hypothetical protein
MFPKDKTIDWAALTDKEFARQIAIRQKAQRRLFEKPVANLTNEEMMECIRQGRFNKQL